MNYELTMTHTSVCLYEGEFIRCVVFSTIMHCELCIMNFVVLFSGIFFKDFSIPFFSFLVENPAPLVKILDHIFHVDQKHPVTFV